MSEQRKREMPPCQRVKLTADSKRRRCGKPGVHCWVIGSMGRHAQVLCNACIEQVRAEGWKVQYQLEGDRVSPINK